MLSIPWRCPQCGLFNTPAATTCDCGYLFGSPKGRRTWRSMRGFLGVRGAVLTAALYAVLLVNAPPERLEGTVDLTCPADASEPTATFASMEECQMRPGCSCGVRPHPFAIPYYAVLLPVALASVVITFCPQGVLHRIATLAWGIVLAGGVHVFLVARRLRTGPFGEVPFFMSMSLLMLFVLSLAVMLAITLIGHPWPRRSVKNARRLERRAIDVVWHS
jgi:hypothetical protein